MTQKTDLLGQRFGMLVVAHEAPSSASGLAYWACTCDCGNTSTVAGHKLRSGETRSCGCLRSTTTKRLKTRHGHTPKGEPHSPEYRAWVGMIQRCTNQRNTGWPRYGGRGISVCDRWRHSFDNFLSDIGLKPSPAHSLDRINNDGNYEPNNCRWATRSEQSRNRTWDPTPAWSARWRKGASHDDASP